MLQIFIQVELDQSNSIVGLIWVGMLANITSPVEGKGKVLAQKRLLCLQCHSCEQITDVIQLQLVVPKELGLVAWCHDSDHLVHQEILEVVTVEVDLVHYLPYPLPLVLHLFHIK
eukprot:10647475-Ditylum_brightwellii.AAC.1